MFHDMVGRASACPNKLKVNVSEKHILGMKPPNLPIMSDMCGHILPMSRGHLCSPVQNLSWIIIGLYSSVEDRKQNAK